jgi:Domain of unknown function (DUF4919)
MIRKTIFAGALLLCLAASSETFSQPKSTQAPNSSYATLLERAKKGDKSVDFKELRLAYTETVQYKPYGADRASRQKMFDSLNAKEYAQALELADKILAGNFLDMNGQFGAFIAHRELGNADKAAYHKFLFDGLVNSVHKSGDGKSTSTAFVVISTDEEYVLLNWLGLRATGQSLIREDNHVFDLMKAVDRETNDAVSYYFNIDKPYNWLGKSLKQ